MIKRKPAFVLTIIIILLFSIIFIINKKTVPVAKAEIDLMGTKVEIEIQDSNAHALLPATIEYMENLANKINEYDPKSEISKINLEAGKKDIKVSPETLELLLTCKDAHNKTHGYFNILGGPLFSLWKNSIRSKTLPAKADIQKSLQSTGIHYLLLNEKKQTARLTNKNARINLEGIGKGYVLDKTAQFLQEKKVDNAVLSSGSTTVVIGSRDKNKPWRIGIKNPRSLELLGTIEIEDGYAVSTSGDYEQFMEINGKIYSHIINPKTGQPAQDCQAVTIVAPNATLADALSTAVFVMGPWEGFKYVESQKGIEALIVKSDGRLITSSGIKFEYSE
ncbi:MAG: FAD:protein FMN transferase [bacterium]